MNKLPEFFIFLAMFILSHSQIGASPFELFIGCYYKFKDSNNVTFKNLSFVGCVTECKKYRVPFIAIKNGDTCHCGNIVDARWSSSKCDLLCSDSNHSCGGINLYAVYSILPYYRGCLSGGFRNPNKSLTYLCQLACEREAYAFMSVELGVCKCSVAKEGSIDHLEGDCTANCSSGQICDELLIEVYSINFIPGLDKSYDDIFQCLSGPLNDSGLCDDGLCKEGMAGKRCSLRNCSVNNGGCKESECKEFQIGNNFYSECLCKLGYNFGYSIYSGCRDKDECRENPCSSNSSSCINSIGSYKCLCNDGYISRAGVCVDKDECLGGGCIDPESTICINTIGSYKCRCRIGYKLIWDRDCTEDTCLLNFLKCPHGEDNCKDFRRPGTCKSMSKPLKDLPPIAALSKGQKLTITLVTSVIMCIIIALGRLQDRKLQNQAEEERRNNSQII